MFSGANLAGPIRTGEERAPSNEWNYDLRLPLQDEGLITRRSLVRVQPPLPKQPTEAI